MKKLEELMQTVDVLGITRAAVLKTLLGAGRPRWCDIHWQQDREQEALLHFGAALEKKDHPAPIALLRKIAHDVVITSIKRSKNLLPLGFEADDLPSDPVLDKVQIAREIGHRLWGLQDSLTPHDWEILDFCRRSGMSLGVKDGEGELVRSVFGLTPSALRSVRKRIRHAYEDLAERAEERSRFMTTVRAHLRAGDIHSPERFLGGLRQNWKAEGHLWAAYAFKRNFQITRSSWSDGIEQLRQLGQADKVQRHHLDQAILLARHAGETIIESAALGMRAQWFDLTECLGWQSSYNYPAFTLESLQKDLDDRDDWMRQKLARRIEDFKAAVSGFCTIHRPEWAIWLMRRLVESSGSGRFKVRLGFAGIVLDNTVIDSDATARILLEEANSIFERFRVDAGRDEVRALLTQLQ